MAITVQPTAAPDALFQVAPPAPAAGAEALRNDPAAETSVVVTLGTGARATFVYNGLGSLQEVVFGPPPPFDPSAPPAATGALATELPPGPGATNAAPPLPSTLLLLATDTFARPGFFPAIPAGARPGAGNVLVGDLALENNGAVTLAPVETGRLTRAVSATDFATQAINTGDPLARALDLARTVDRAAAGLPLDDGILDIALDATAAGIGATAAENLAAEESRLEILQRIAQAAVTEPGTLDADRALLTTLVNGVSVTVRTPLTDRAEGLLAVDDARSADLTATRVSLATAPASRAETSPLQQQLLAELGAAEAETATGPTTEMNDKVLQDLFLTTTNQNIFNINTNPSYANALGAVILSSAVGRQPDAGGLPTDLPEPVVAVQATAPLRATA